MRPDYWCYPSPRGTTALTRPLFTVWPSRVPASGWRPRERSPTVLAGYSDRRDRQGFHGLSHGYVASRRRGNPRAARGGRSRAACLPSSAMPPRDFRKPPNPGRLTAAISSPAAPAVPRNSFSRRPSRRMRATTSPAGLAAPRPAPRNSPFSSRTQAGEFSPPPRSGRPGNSRSPCSITGRRPARFPRARRGPG
jgi:hypothetical protein